MRGVAVACPLSGIVRLQAAVGRALTGTRWGLCHLMQRVCGLDDRDSEPDPAHCGGAGKLAPACRLRPVCGQ